MRPSLNDPLRCPGVTLVFKSAVLMYAAFEHWRDGRDMKGTEPKLCVARQEEVLPSCIPPPPFIYLFDLACYLFSSFLPQLIYLIV